MTRVRSVAIVNISTDRDPVTTRVHRNRTPRVVTRCFPINVTTELRPRAGGVFVDAHVTCARSVAIISISTDRDPVTGRVHRDRIAREVTCCLAINVCAKLRPRTGGVFVNAHVTRVESSTVIIFSSDRDPVTGRVHGDGIARLVICCLPINVCAELLSDPVQGSGVIGLTGGCSVTC